MRIRTVKPEFFVHEGIFNAEYETKLPLRLAFAGLWGACDREGRFKWEPRRLGVQILPYDGIEFSRVLDALVTRGFVVKYRVGDAWFGCVPSFSRHQVINNREAGSVLPSPNEENAEKLGLSRVNDASGTRDSREDHACQGEGKGREGKEGKGKEGYSASAPDVGPVEMERLLDPIPTKTMRMQAARPFLHLLNECSGRKFRETEANLLLIAARIEEPGVDPAGVMAMVRRQCARWKSDPKMSEYLRPETLFGKTKFESYYASRDLPIPDTNSQHKTGTSTTDDSDF